MLNLAYIIISLIITVPLFRAASVFAQTPSVMSAPPETSISTGGISALITLINSARNWIFGILLAIVVVFILIAAFKFLTSGGDEKKVASAKKTLQYSIIALIIGLLSGGIIVLVGSFVDSASSRQNNSNPSSGVPTPNGPITPVPPAPLVTGCNLSGCILPGQACDTVTGNCVYGSGKSCTSDEQCGAGEWCKDSICQSSSGNPVGGSQGSSNTNSNQSGQQTPSPAGSIQNGDVCYGVDSECASGVCDCSTLISNGKCFCK